MPADWKPEKRVRDPGLLRQMHLEGGRCVVGAGCEGPLELDHIVRRSQGGSDVRENLRWLCRLHHQMLHSGNITL